MASMVQRVESGKLPPPVTQPIYGLLTETRRWDEESRIGKNGP